MLKTDDIECHSSDTESLLWVKICVYIYIYIYILNSY